jgi:hypothetical protein
MVLEKLINPNPMPPKLKFHLKWIVPAVVVILLVLTILSQTPQVISATVSPEVIVKGQNQEVTVSVILKPGLYQPKTIKATISQRGYNGQPKTESDWLKYYSVFERNTKTLGYLKQMGKDSGNNLIYKGVFSVDYAEADTFMVNLMTPVGTSYFSQPEIIPTLSETEKMDFFGQTMPVPKDPPKLQIAVSNQFSVLPPDPGSNGKMSLQGIDSDKDGIRDDVQREIFFLAPDSQKVRMALRQVVIPELDLAGSIDLPSSSVNSLWAKFFDGASCFDYLLIGDPTDYKNYSIAKSYLGRVDLSVLINTIDNTNSRITTDKNNSDKHGSGSTGIESISRCSFNPADYPD